MTEPKLHQRELNFHVPLTANAVFGKIGRSASEEVILKFIHSKCVPICYMV